MVDHERGRGFVFWYDEVPSERLGRWDVEVRPGAGGGSGRHDEIRRGRNVGLKQELVASSACDIRARWEGAHQGGHLLVQLPVTKTFYDCPFAHAPAPCTCTLHLTKRYKIAWRLHVNRKNTRLDSAFLGCSFAEYALADGRPVSHTSCSFCAGHFSCLAPKIKRIIRGSTGERHASCSVTQSNSRFSPHAA